MNLILAILLLVVRLRGGSNKKNHTTTKSITHERVIDDHGDTQPEGEHPMKKDITSIIIGLLVIFASLALAGLTVTTIIPMIQGGVSFWGIFFGIIFAAFGLIGTLAIKQVSEEAQSGQRITLEITDGGNTFRLTTSRR